jgi:uncharacterized membrane protein
MIIGIITATVGLNIQNDIANSATGCSKTVQKATTGIIVLSTVMLTLTVTLIYCNYTCSKVNSNELSGTMLGTYYFLFLMLSVILTTLGALIKNNSKNAQKPCPKIQNKANAVMGIGIAGIVIMLGPFVLKLAYHGGKMAKKSYDKRSKA